MSIQQLHDVLLSAYSNRESGKTYIYVRDQGFRRVGLILISRGEISAISYSEKTSMEALETLLSLGIESVIFMPRSDVENNSREADLPPTLKILLQLQARFYLIAKTVVNLNNDHLRQEVEIILTKIYGPAISKEIDKIAKTHPLDVNPRGFLDQCKSKVMLMLSKSQVETLFKPLYDKIL